MDNNRELEKAMGKKAHREFSLLKPGNVPNTWANLDYFFSQFDGEPGTSVEKSGTNFVEWIKIYYK